jgi:FAD-dependent oxidoreductase family protein
MTASETRRTITEPSREIPVAEQADVLVAGGGVAGIAAALASARHGADTLLVERGAFLGGTATSALMHVFYTPYHSTRGILREICDRLSARSAAELGELIPFDPEGFKYVVMKMLAEARARLLLHSYISRVLVQDGEVHGLVVENKSGRQAILARVVVDATGDGDVSALAGAPFEIGRSSDGKTRPMTLLFRMGGVNTATLKQYVKDHPEEFTADPNTTSIDPAFRSFRIFGFFSLVDAARERGEIDADCHWVRVEGLDEARGMVLINSTNVYSSGIDAAALTNAELSGRRQVHQLEAFLRKCVPGFAGAYLVEVGGNIGVRETRRILGDYVLTEQDVAEDRQFPDVVALDWERHSRLARGGGIDPHIVGGHSPDGQTAPRPAGADRPDPAPLIPVRVPYRCLVVRELEGLLVAGRCISTTHEAQGYTRNQGCCVATGQAAGIAAALAIGAGISPRRVSASSIQQKLLEVGVDPNAPAPSRD